MSSEKFFRKSDWLACLATFIVSLIGYILTLQPTLGLEDSGELVVASDYLGVPHPPGYPIWSLLTWFFQWVFHSVTYNGHPNPAWAVNLFSAVAGAAACGVLAMLISRSGFDLLRSLGKQSDMLGERTESLFCAVAGFSGGLLLAFGQGMWSQSVIAEVYSLNILFQSLLLVFLYRWISNPADSKWLILCVFTFGLGITNHQTLMFMGLAIATAIFCKEHDIVSWEFLSFIGALVLGVGAIALFMSSGVIHNMPEGQNPPSISVWKLLLSLVFAGSTGGICYYGLKRKFLIILLSLLAIVIAAYGIMMNLPLLFGLGLAAALTPCFFTKNESLLRDFLIAGIAFILLFGVNKFAADTDWSWAKGPAHFGFWVWTIYAVAVPVALGFLLPNGKVVAPALLALWVGLAFYLYMPFSSDQNPPINWGYPRTWQGFMHAITRGQYERVTLANVFSLRFLQQIWAYTIDLRAQFYGPIALMAAIPFFFVPKLGRKNNSWLLTTFVGFFFVSIFFMVLHNPKMDIQSQFIGRTQYIQSHALYVIWIGYGLLLMMAFLETLVRNNPVTKIGGVLMVALLPLALVHKNYHSERQKMIVGGCEQNGHSFGWQFGNWQLRGVDGIREDLEAWYSPEEFEQQWEAYPNKAYPPPMGTNAIFFGGTDPGRFVPTYMIYSAKVRPDVYLITQNALADNTYMNVMRDLYGDQIWIPSPIDSNMAFQMYVDGIRKGTIQAGANVNTEGGKVQVQGVQGVMQINAFLTKMIFDHNQYRTETKTDEKTRPVGAAVVHEDPPIDPETGLPPKRSFYVEESYVLQWMYPYLTPHGLIMKINNKPTPLTAEMIKNDTDFWNWYCERLLNDERFIRDIVARKSFSKLRTALAGLFHARGKRKEAEAAYHQAVKLYDLSPEANFRLATLISQEGRFDEAIKIFDVFLEKDPKNEQAAIFRRQLINTQQMTEEYKQLENKLKSGTADYKDGFRLIELYMKTQRIQRADVVAKTMLEKWNLPPEAVLELANVMARHQRYAIVEAALVKYTVMKPGDPIGWLNLGALQLALNKRTETFVSLQKAIECGGEPVKQSLRKDRRFDPLRNDREFQKLVPPQVTPGTGLIPLPGI